MRLNEYEKKAILDSCGLYDSKAVVYLFGSRVDDAKKGGDIDLLVMSEKLTRDDRRAIRLRLHELLGEQKIDIIIAFDDSDPFVKMALETGVRL
jgi:predicted nucleotidyltransferase